MLFWAGRKAAFPAVGQITPDYMCLDGSVPRGRLVEVLAGMREMSKKHRLRVVNVFHDITRLRQLEEIRREFVANVSHELRTPLSIFQGYLETLMDAPEMEKAELTQILQVMSRHSQRLNALLEDLLTIARLESRQESLDRVELLLPPFLEQIGQDWQGKFSEKKVRLIMNAPADLLPLRVDPFRFEQVLNNLLENALKYTAEAGCITISASQADGATEVSVEDTGIGIPAADLPHIFERFYRVEKARS